MIRRWRRLDEAGLEVLSLQVRGDAIEARSWIVHAGETPFALHYSWTLDTSWSTRTLRLESHAAGDRVLLIERTGAKSWRLDGQSRPDLDGCAELDVSATPFCNSLAIRRLGERAGELTTAYVDVPQLSVAPSRQRYESVAPGRWRYVDLGVDAGFEALLELDEAGLVSRYEGLFEALPASGGCLA
jgi:uncharacterized protein